MPEASWRRGVETPNAPPKAAVLARTWEEGTGWEEGQYGQCVKLDTHDFSTLFDPLNTVPPDTLRHRISDSPRRCLRLLLRVPPCRIYARPGLGFRFPLRFGYCCSTRLPPLSPSTSSLEPIKPKVTTRHIFHI